MQIDIITLFPDIFFGPLDESIIGRARKKGLVTINAINLRDFTHDARGTVDDSPYGGGPGMLMKPEPIFEAVEALRREDSLVLMTSPRGKRFDQRMAQELSGAEHIIMVCGHYEGVDERVHSLVDLEVSIGDYVLTSGNLAAMVICDATVRLLPEVLGCEESSAEESFSGNLLEYPQYTRPVEFRGMKVPDVLLSGNHAEIASWRKSKALELTRQLRSDLLKNEIN
ncbi:MAG: tRNA (guanosine(37)-N1)-methyltransferase TrmD [Victivallaceae bacterium]|nr:tRNA (guanosine(37)-N1)-methyltransferase TrmD [Victivallaceae bacterium]MDD4180963.1 tRNA (guanosine(37)-N1)-methyltransferase TrmD [Victivallaceae bacterium]